MRKLLAVLLIAGVAATSHAATIKTTFSGTFNCTSLERDGDWFVCKKDGKVLEFPAERVVYAEWEVGGTIVSQPTAVVHFGENEKIACIYVKPLEDWVVCRTGTKKFLINKASVSYIKAVKR
jgi:hypothetical protein